MGLATERDIGRVRNADANTLGAPTSTEEKDPEVITVAKERQTITEKDALYLGFLGKFPGADAEALSYLRKTEQNPFGNPAGHLTKPSGVTKRMQKLTSLKAATRYRNPITGKVHYGITELGHEAAIYWGYDFPVVRGLDGLALSRLEHYRKIALVAAQFMSPAAIYQDSLGVAPVEMRQLVSENEMRNAYEATRTYLRKERDSGRGSDDFASYRRTLTRNLLEGSQDVRTMTAEHPCLYTVATEDNPSSKMKPIHQPDLAINLDLTERQTDKATNILVEVELSQKSPEEYGKILRTLKHDIRKGSVYGRVIYFVGTRAIENALRSADAREQTNFIDSGRMSIVRITGRGLETEPKKSVVPSLPSIDGLVGTD